VAEELLASLEDINTFLDAKAKMGDGDDDKLQVEAQRVIKSMLFGVFTPVTLSSWSSPGSTPGTIRGIAGRLIAAYWYKELYSEETSDVPQYAQGLYNEAIGMLRDIRAGTLTVLTDANESVEASGLEPDNTWFWPNKTTTPSTFSRDQEFG
jgi:hypothetical protein